MDIRKYTSANFGEMDKTFRRNFFNSLTGFKSLTLIGTSSEQGLPNLAPFSQVFHVGASPALLGVLFRPLTDDSHTLRNILATSFFTCNHVSPHFFEAAHQASARYPLATSEFEAVGLHTEYSELKAPYVRESVVRIGLKLAQEVKLINDTHLVVGEIIEVFAPDNIIGTDGFLDLEEAQIVTCSGLDSYHTTQKLARLPYAKQ